MASNRKAQKETDQAIKHLMDYVCRTSPWDALFDELMYQFIAPVADGLDREDIDQVLADLLEGPYEGIAFGFMFEEMCSVSWDDKGNATTTYLKQRGWREKPHGKNYLRALADSSVKMWEVTDVDPGKWIDVRVYNTKNKPKRVHERSASETLTMGQTIAAKVMLLDKSYCLSGALLPLSQLQAALIQQELDAVPAEIEASYQQLVEEELTSADVPDLAPQIHEAKETLLVRMAFNLWATECLLATHHAPALPQIRNTNDEAILLTKHRFPIQRDKQAIEHKLNERYPRSDGIWHWIDSSDIVIAQINLTQTHLKIETNSVDRGNQCIEQLQTLLGDLIGKPIGVHETLEAAMANNPSAAKPEASISHEELQKQPEVQAHLQNYLTEHYRKVLDEPIPMLDNQSPRECAANEQTREKAIHWLKNMELHNLKSGQSFDTTWIREELGLSID